MKVFSLYYNDEFVASFPTKESTISYGKKHYGDDAGWDCSIVEEYLSKTPLTYTSLHSMPCDKKLPDIGITLLPGTPQINTYGSVRAEDYPVELVGEPGPEPHS
jgi:hypothetical protein